jgi:hypothetical protein
MNSRSRPQPSIPNARADQPQQGRNPKTLAELATVIVEAEDIISRKLKQ